MNTAILLFTVLCAIPLAMIVAWGLIKFRFHGLPAGQQSVETLSLAMVYLIAAGGITAVGLIFQDWRLVAGLSALVIIARATYGTVGSKVSEEANHDQSEALLVGRASGSRA